LNTWPLTLDKGRADVFWGVHAAETVVVGDEPDEIVIDGKAFHGTGGINGFVFKLVFEVPVIEFGEHVVGLGIDFQHYAMVPAEHVQFAVEPGQIRIV
jgi:hypothetical protein